MIVLPVQGRKARVALGLGVRELAHVACVSTQTISRFERGEEFKPVTLIASNGGGPGVRLRKGGQA
ncbi:MAG: helix-turn-helix transcriptional regulator [Rhodospirillaceae bacterium]